MTRGAAIVLLVLGLYFSLLLLPHFSRTGTGAEAFVYFLSVPVVLSVLVACALAAFILDIRRDAVPRQLVIVPVGGLLLFGASILANVMFARGLPAGSFRRPFDARVWQTEASWRSVQGDITPRQQMLGDVVRRLRGKSRAEIERMLGPSLDTPYFGKSGRDLIYMTGSERSMFSIDSEWLLIWVDANGRFERYDVTTD